MSRITTHADATVVILDRGDALEGALVKLKKKVIAAQIFQELKKRAAYLPPRVRRRAKAQRAKRRRARAAQRQRGIDSDWKPERA